MIVQNLSNKEYHAHPAIGSSIAKKMLVSPRLFRDCQEGIGQKDSSDAMGFGTLCHMFFLENERYKAGKSVGPINQKTGKPYGADTIAYAEWEAANPDAIVVSRKDEDILNRLNERMNSDVCDIIDSEIATKEESVFVEDQDLPIKCRNDLRIGTHIFDIKTINDISKIDYHISDYGYAFSAAWYRRVMLLATGLPHDFTLIFAETASPYRWRIVELPQEMVSDADRDVQIVLDMIRTCRTYEDWSDRSAVHQIAKLGPRLI